MPRRKVHTVTEAEAVACARRLKAEREAAHLTQEEWARKHGVSTRTVARWEGATNEPLTPAQVAMMAGAMEKSFASASADLAEVMSQFGSPEKMMSAVAGTDQGRGILKEVSRLLLSAAFVSDIHQMEDRHSIQRGALVADLHSALVSAKKNGVTMDEAIQMTDFFSRSAR